MDAAPQNALRVADLKPGRPTRFDLRPDTAMLDTIRAELDLLGLRKLRFAGELVAQGKRDWRLTADLGATVVQPCTITLEPVTTRIDQKITRLFVAEMDAPSAEEVEMPEDDAQEPLGEVIDLDSVMIEALSLALPDYPRADGAELAETRFTEPGQTAMTDDDAKPFAGLAALRDKLEKKD